MNALERLQRLYSIISRIPSNQLSFDRSTQDPVKGTIADPLVWAALDFDFIAQGFHLEVVSGYSHYRGDPTRIFLVPVFGDYQCHHAACLFFNLQNDETASLFLEPQNNKETFLQKLADII